ncbi:MAG: ribosome biogenesis GTP-binding protein YihA/YsxC [Thermoanaerobaculia bacterium]|nr:ribosome biogenesis GTP-binding protein YihA/YsxC [Thermoanaerobaculia bacterium]
MRIESAEFVRSTVIGSGPSGDGSPEVAFVGRSNVGKSSLLNRLLGRKLAHTSSTPGRTRTLNWFRINRRYWFVDLPGYGFARTSRDERETWARSIDAYLRDPSGRRLVIHLVDAKVGATRLDEEAAQYLADLGVARTVVATKFDRLKRGERAARLAEIRSALGLAGGTEVIPVSALSGEGVRELWKHIAEFLAGPVPPQERKEGHDAEGDRDRPAG